MTDFSNFAQHCEENLNLVIKESSKEISSWYNSDFFTFEPSNRDYKLYEKSLSCANKLFVKNLHDYHNWLLDNFNISPKN